MNLIRNTRYLIGCYMLFFSFDHAFAVKEKHDAEAIDTTTCVQIEKEEAKDEILELRNKIQKELFHNGWLSGENTIDNKSTDNKQHHIQVLDTNRQNDNLEEKLLAESKLLAERKRLIGTINDLKQDLKRITEKRDHIQKEINDTTQDPKMILSNSDIAIGAAINLGMHDRSIASDIKSLFFLATKILLIEHGISTSKFHSLQEICNYCEACDDCDDDCNNDKLTKQMKSIVRGNMDSCKALQERALSSIQNPVACLVYIHSEFLTRFHNTILDILTTDPQEQDINRIALYKAIIDDIHFRPYQEYSRSTKNTATTKDYKSCYMPKAIPETIRFYELKDGLFKIIRP
ncbi:MAG: hypothetical protein QS748_04075 [Candidatus Endonucleobacter bathymodioli]|uniref:Uncharacterized protein n=1 Tax=Candidatus Endonucleibacter bathymodioli TaxID=539814 RepID=A0AA90NS94_9GAMM|nr:hypothetical protein [Candidatus Endonucleobacter bathymodioli]